MLDYDKIIKKLGNFDELSKKKREKLFDSIFISDDYRNWFYSMGDTSQNPPMTKAMIEKLFGTLANPKYLKRVTKYVNNKTSEDFDHTACTIAFLIIDQAVDASNKANREIAEGYKNGELQSKDAREYKEKSDKYNELVSDLMDALKEKAKDEVKDICRKTNLPRGLVYTTYFQIPARKYVQKYKTPMYMNQLLQEIYKWTGMNGIEDTSSIRWGSYFGTLFGNELVPSVALAILLEGVRRIDDYRNFEHFEDVREIWDSLTNFAMTELDKAPENVRRQMMDLYIKRINKLFHNGNGPRLRVDMLSIPNSFHNLANTVSQYAGRISAITKANSKDIEDIRRDSSSKFNPLIEKDEEDDSSSIDIDDDEDDE